MEWTDKIEHGLWNAFNASSEDVMNIWAAFIVSRMKSAKQSYPSEKPISIGQGNLVRAIQGKQNFQDMFSQDESKSIYERTINLPYANLSEEGGNVPATEPMRRAMFAKLKSTGRYLNDETLWTHKAIFEHKPFHFINDSINEVDVNMFERTFREHIENELGKIDDLEVKIG